ncbi:MAG: SUMF1/EgtB/PvdO family nonheme iron enzyme [Chitinispirillaceae bacterium]|nr:SUMF1/EgtB/PvdO family nonheme iron enzyme [Chitinispirillaceae bacterium]
MVLSEAAVSGHKRRGVAVAGISRICYGTGVLLLLFTLSFAGEQPEQLRCKIIDIKGAVQLWSKTSSAMGTLKRSDDLSSGKTLILKDDASLHLTFEPLIDLFIEKSTIIGFDNLLVERTGGVIRMHCTMEKGTFFLKAPSQAGHTLLFTLRTPAATIDVSTVEISITVSDDGTTVAEVRHGSAKVLPLESALKTVLNSGSRGEIKRSKPQVMLSGIGDSTAVLHKKHQKQPSIAILSVKSKDKSEENLEHISNSVASAFEKSTSAKVLFLDDVKKLLHAEGVDRLLDCFTDSCISRIGAQAGVDIVIVGNLGQLGTTHILDLKMVDVLRDKLLKRTSISVTDDLGLILKEIPGAIGKLVETDLVLTSVVESPATAEPASTPALYQEKIVWIFPGGFVMGSNCKSGEVDELPAHKVKLNGFFIDRFEVTRDEFEKVMGYNPSSAKGCSNCPVTDVTWQEASDYCTKVGKRLPTEAQWEYACRAGSTTPFYTGMTITGDQANFNAQKPFGGSPLGPFKGKIVPVGSFPHNSWNLHDMYGNAAEWCADWYDIAYYGNSLETNPPGPKTGKLKVVRGGGWSSDGNGLRSSNRMAYNPELRLNTIGFRCVQPDEPDVPKKK